MNDPLLLRRAWRPLLPLLMAPALGAAPPQAESPPPAAAPAAAAFRLDGEISEWQGREASLADPRGDAISGPIDFGRIWMADTPDSLWILIEVSEQPVNLQSMPISVEIAIDIDPDSRRPTGRSAGGEGDAAPLAGADLLIRFSPPGDGPRNRGRGASVELLREQAIAGRAAAGLLTAHEAGIAAAPSYAATGIELRIPRAVPGDSRGGVRFGSEVALAVRALDPSGRELDAAAVARHAFSTRPAAAPRGQRLPRPDAAELRTVSWNLENGAHRTDAASFGGVLSSLAPRLLLLQELSAEDTRESLAAWLNERLPSTREPAWQVVVSGGRIPVAVAFRGAIEAVPGLDPVKRPSPGGDREIRAIGGIVEFEGRRLLAVSVHLKCCGHIGSGEDATREAEAVAIRDAVREAIERHATDRPIEGIVIGGDFNLVGSREVLFLAKERIDLDGSDLSKAEIATADGLSVATWGHDRSEFVPGQLDFILFSDSALSLRRSQVADPGALLGPALSRQPSDHRPIVADFGWAAASTTP